MDKVVQRKVSGVVLGRAGSNQVDAVKIVPRQAFAEGFTKVQNQRVLRQSYTLMDDVKSQVELLSRIFSEKQKMNKELSDKIEQSQIQLDYAVKQTQLEAEKVQILSSRQGFISFKTENLYVEVSRFMEDVDKFEDKCVKCSKGYISKLAQIKELKEVIDTVIAADKLNKSIVINVEKQLHQYHSSYEKVNSALQDLIERKHITKIHNENINADISNKLDRQHHIEHEFDIHSQRINELKEFRDIAKLNFEVNKNKLLRLTGRQDTNKKTHDESIHKLGLLIDSARARSVDLEDGFKVANAQYQDKLVTQSKCVEKQSMLQEAIITCEASNKILQDRVEAALMALDGAIGVKDVACQNAEKMRKVLSLKFNEAELAEARASTLEKELQDYYAQTIDKMSMLKALRHKEPKLHAILSEEVVNARQQEVSLVASIDETAVRAAKNAVYLEQLTSTSNKLDEASADLNINTKKLLDLNGKTERQLSNVSDTLTVTAKAKSELASYQSLLMAHGKLSHKLEQLSADCDRLKSKRVSLEHDITNFSSMTQSQKNYPLQVDNKVELPLEYIKQAQAELDTFRDACNRELRAESETIRIVINNIENRKSSPSYLLREKKELEVIQDEVNRLIRSKQAGLDVSEKVTSSLLFRNVATPFKKPSKTSIAVKATSPDYLFDEYSK